MTTEIGTLPVISGGLEHMSSYVFQNTNQDLPVGEIRRVGGSAFSRAVALLAQHSLAQQDGTIGNGLCTLENSSKTAYSDYQVQGHTHKLSVKEGRANPILRDFCPNLYKVCCFVFQGGYMNEKGRKLEEQFQGLNENSRKEEGR